MKKYIIDEDKLKKIVEYLQTRPYAEVWQGVEWLVNLTELKEDEKKEGKKCQAKVMD